MIPAAEMGRAMQVIFLASFITIYTIFIWEPKSVADIVNLGGVTNEDVKFIKGPSS